jgi:hypothetical protein
MEASQHSLLAACFTLHSINATLATVPQHGAGLWIDYALTSRPVSSVTPCSLVEFLPKFLGKYTVSIFRVEGKAVQEKSSKQNNFALLACMKHG